MKKALAISVAFGFVLGLALALGPWVVLQVRGESNRNAPPSRLFGELRELPKAGKGDVWCVLNSSASKRGWDYHWDVTATSKSPADVDQWLRRTEEWCERRVRVLDRFEFDSEVGRGLLLTYEQGPSRGSLLCMARDGHGAREAERIECLVILTEFISISR